MKRSKADTPSLYKTIRNRLCLFLMLITSLSACGGETETETVADKPVAVEAESETAGAAEWDYENTNWEEISGVECRANVQSPVNINTQEAIEAELADIRYEYEPFPMKIVDNGHTVQVYGTETSFITVEGKRYQFKQFHYHYPSEHTIDGEQYPLEMHLVHQEEGTSNLVVLAVFIEEGTTVNPFLEKVFTQIPAQKEEEVQTEVQLTLSDYIPPTQTHYTYIGSLTTPPCTVGVDWIVFREPLQASEEQIAKFSALYANNARPVQPLNNRRVLKTEE
ncbi:carbonic anhydrase family protein [Pontibacter diazotrophicus]|uniref:Carbonic anhydrase n=1 Tax=Pontibacter diazotrophicus TaxID=1400979 RepID=A0A3D8L8C3_9BACT|nr:carbonic anhydrase family protein [Pontibacter diazotrophicus]RDV13659.1 carbonic anhydrase family protein [Pontibacter diazotrophicus]